ncbi:ribonuclease PH, partial [Marinobacter sp. B9-2]
AFQSCFLDFEKLLNALNHLVAEKRLKKSPLKQMVAALSVGVYKGTPVVDLDYPEDSEAETDMNVIMTDQGGFIEIQGTAEGAPFVQEELDNMLVLARQGIEQLFEIQKTALEG